jgi:nucleotide-binding universal stress UspA family protein
MGAVRLEVGGVIDGFTLKERIAVGGMGSIWRVSHPDHPMPLVMKTPFLGAGADVSTIVAYETEEMILRRLEGPHVPRLIAAGDLRTRPYLVMELVDGAVLEAQLARENFTWTEAVRVAARIAEALESLHRQHVVHLDLKPGNVILADRGAVLIDFGLARHDELPDLLGEESDGPMGSPITIAPEQLLGDRRRPESDIFALGVILYRLCTGECPFGQPTSMAGQKRRLFKAPLPPRSLDGKIPRWLQEVILKCLEVDPDARYRTAGQLLFDLNHPDQVMLTERADLLGRESGWLQRLAAWLRGRKVEGARPRRIMVARRISSAPVVMVAVDLIDGADPLAQEVRMHVSRVLAGAEGARLACVTVLRTRIIGEDPSHDVAGRTRYVSRLVSLKDWARPLDLAEDRVSFHVIEAVDPGNAILDYVKLNRVDHVVMGARGSGALRRHLGSVSSAVVAEALCTVTVVRLKEIAGEHEG